jgi:NitT/TauT family transport system permease protein
MVAAYTLAVAFSLGVGLAASTSRRAASLLLPLLDILQSIPIFGFFPAALVFFVGAFQGHPLGLELAVVFLIFTSMAWNMAFGVYESLTTIPRDLEVAADSFGLRGGLRFRRVMFPAMVPKLVYNSMLSWSNGWYFLVASEVFAAFGATHVRPGLGSFIAEAGIAGATDRIAIGIAALATLVLLLDVLVWRPTSLWAERFRLDTTGMRVARVPGPYERLKWLPRFSRMRTWLRSTLRPAAAAWRRVSQTIEGSYGVHPKILHGIALLDLGLFLAIFAIVGIAGAAALLSVLSRPLPSEAMAIPSATAHSFLRLLAAYGLALAWTIPLAAWVGRSPWASRFMIPFLEVSASLPATALLPAILGLSIVLLSSVGLEAQLAALLIALFSMQWYLLFNLIAGVRSIPADLEEAARAFGLRGRAYWKRLLLPALVPSLITGSITAWGAGWNALIVSEYIPFGQRVYRVPGLGAMLSEATFVGPNTTVILLTVLTMVVTVVGMNKLLWRPLYRRASARFRLEIG